MEFTCQDIQDRWSEYIYRELSEPEQSQFVAHLSHCPECASQEAEWRTILTRFDSIATMDGTMDAPSDLVYHVKRHIHLYEEWSYQMRNRLYYWLFGAVTVTVLLACTVLYKGLIFSDMKTADQALAPIQNTVLDSLYDDGTLDVYRAQGVLEDKQQDGELLTDRKLTYSHSKKTNY